MTTIASVNGQFVPATNVEFNTASEYATIYTPTTELEFPVVVPRRAPVERYLEELRPEVQPVIHQEIMSCLKEPQGRGYGMREAVKQTSDMDNDANTKGSTLALLSKQATALRVQTLALVKHPKFQTIALGGGSGLVIMGSTCAFVGGGAGVTIGTIVGCVPALFTFGLSIPVGAAIGGGVGTCLGLALGGGSGVIVGGAAGHVGHAYRVELKNGFLYIKTKSGERKVNLQVFIAKVAAGTRSKAMEITSLAQEKAVSTQQQVRVHIVKRGKQAHELVSHPKFQATAASAAGGAAVGGAGGGAAGLITGGTIGAAVGLIPALFTFGLSIPVGAAIGGGTGLCVGTLAGSSAGALGGGTTGYSVHTYRNEIKAGANHARTKVGEYGSVLKTRLIQIVG